MADLSIFTDAPESCYSLEIMRLQKKLIVLQRKLEAYRELEEATLLKTEEMTVYVPEKKVFIKASFGTGMNTDCLSEGLDDYIDYTVYDISFEETDGGQMDFNMEESGYDSDMRKAMPDVVLFALEEECKYVPISGEV